MWGCAVWGRHPFMNSWMDASEYGVLRLGQKAVWSLLGVCSIARPPSDTVVTHYLNTHCSRGLERATRDWVINQSHQGLGHFLKRLIRSELRNVSQWSQLDSYFSTVLSHLLLCMALVTTTKHHIPVPSS